MQILLDFGLVCQEDLVFLLCAGVAIKTSPVLLHEGSQSFLEMGVDHYFLQFGNDRVEFGILGSLVGTYMEEGVL